MKTNLALIKELPGIKFASQYTPQKDTRGEIFLVGFEPEAPTLFNKTTIKWELKRQKRKKMQ